MHDFEFCEDAASVEIDRLVDGALGDDEERDLLARLDALPGGWRRLALAFCEDRAWRAATSLRHADDVAAIAVVRPAATAQPYAATRRGWFVPAFVGAVALLVGLGAGLAWNRPDEGDLADGGVPAMPTAGHPGEAGDPADAGDAAPQEAPEMLEVLVHDGRAVRRMRVPVVSAAEAEVEWMDVERPVVPAEVRKAFEAAGHQVAESRQFLRVPLDAEHDALVPVGQFSVQRVEYQ